MQQLIAALQPLLSKLPKQQQDELNNQRDAIYPFNKVEYIIAHLLAHGDLTLAQYCKLRNDYISRNRYLPLFEMAPRTFGETWAQNYLTTNFMHQAEKPSRHHDPDYSGQYDLWLKGIRVEVKASRVVKKIGGKTLAEKALNSQSGEPFDMNFQQLKPRCCDVFVWLAVWTDKIDYWVLTSGDVQHSKHLSNQHRGSQAGGNGQIWEGQIHINNLNYASFEQYRVQPDDIEARIKQLCGKP